MHDGLCWRFTPQSSIVQSCWDVSWVELSTGKVLSWSRTQHSVSNDPSISSTLPLSHYLMVIQPAVQEYGAHQQFRSMVHTSSSGVWCTPAVQEYGAHQQFRSMVHTSSSGVWCTPAVQEYGAHQQFRSMVHTSSSGIWCTPAVQELVHTSSAGVWCTPAVQEYGAH